MIQLKGSVQNNGFFETKSKKILSRTYDPQSFQSSNKGCAICRQTFASIVALRKHLHSHIFFQNPCKKLTKISKSLFNVQLCTQPKISFEVRNVGKCNLQLGNIYIINQNNATAKSLDQNILEKGKTTFVGVDLSCVDPKSQNTIIIQAIDGSREYFEHRELNACCRRPYEIAKNIKLKKFEMCKDLTALLAKSDSVIDSYFRSQNAYATKLDCKKYELIFSELSMVERITTQFELNTYHLENVSVKRSQMNRTGKDLFEVVVRNVKDTMSKLTSFDHVRFTHPDLKLTITGNIFVLLKDCIVFEKNNHSKNFDLKLLYDMTFHVNTYTYDMETEALRIINAKGIADHLFPDVVNSRLHSMQREFKWFNKDIESNPLQIQAVHHIVGGTAHPAPYILFGPPGTGKTKTLVEAISQIYVHNEKSRILVCATSNAAADELAMRIIQNLPNSCWNNHQMYRIYSSSYVPEIPIPKILRDCSNFDLKFCPNLKFLSKFRIIIATLLMGGSLRYAKLDPGYFTHLFIDECGSATEISTLVPIACAPRAQIILSGDPKQLGPVLISKHASGFGLGLSMLERLIDMKVYQKHPESNLHNPNVLTKLRFNYRSHPAIIALSNGLFYNGDLIAKGNTKNTHCFVDWTHLPSAGTPIIFHACTTQSQRENNSTSIFNMDEIIVLLKYIERIMKEKINGRKVRQEDIGIISPYKKQCHKIKDKLEAKGLVHIMVATVEKFQGKEKPIILVSTTRCKMGGIGFLRSPKRLNVLLTRAECLMIIVGDPNTLKCDKNWRDVLEEFKRSGVCTGVPFVLDTPGKGGKNKNNKKLKNRMKSSVKKNAVKAPLKNMLQKTNVNDSKNKASSEPTFLDKNNIKRITNNHKSIASNIVKPSVMKNPTRTMSCPTALTPAVANLVIANITYSEKHKRYRTRQKSKKLLNSKTAEMLAKENVHPTVLSEPDQLVGQFNDLTISRTNTSLSVKRR